ncbi:hypothetical protein N0V83_006826 [Neocucurbitaria cava]|uniref:Uncharacterized protein n=1 Tax=Neocucurbitaria cava TaxID=798079 RepID=A0A9W8Y8B8_9PLEO|nr:hypothetical protein N0V83_006826 [Neocucurbitaria cava]
MDSKRSSRKILEAKGQSKRRVANMPEGRKKTTGRVQKPALDVPIRLPYELTPAQVRYAQGLAAIGTPSCPQYPNAELLERMRQKPAPPAHTAAPDLIPSRTPSSSGNDLKLPVPLYLSTPSQPGMRANWEAEALEVIRKRGFSLDNLWSANTWNMKSSREARLKLLKDDGYDITPLTIKGVTSAQITQAILGHIESRKQQIQAVTLPKQGMEKAVQDHGGVQQSTQLVDELHGRSKNRLQARRFKSSVPAKRKDCHEDEEMDQDAGTPTDGGSTPLPCSDGPALKKLCTLSPAERRKKIEIKPIKRNIFYASRIAQKSFTTVADPSPSDRSVPQSQMTPRSPIPASRIVFSPYDRSPRPLNLADVNIGSRGLRHMVDEMKYLSDTEDGHGVHYLLEPETSDSGKGYDENPSVMKSDVIDAAAEYSLQDKRYRHRISMAEGLQGGIVLQGDARALQGLLKHLRTGNLIHPKEWFFDGTDMVRRDIFPMIPFSLADGTKTVLAKVESMLERGQDEGGLVVRVGQIWDGRKLRWG